MTNNQRKDLEDLLNGEIEEIYIKKEDFMNFREVLFESDKQEQVIGTAKIGGDVIYRRKEKNNI
ncbi:hypothetical protein SAMN02745116_01489 [Pilibacter termitis]|uniref:Uncharacterized protein n=1 Tax=Pilibacter termitis TaxID=263852 RepID=A0A1T4NPJ8_9ENTE|nr:hypothetical protein [Pilibacter termitis]SJZ81035.1 hypothetical protein SAMN02745116_01489 [Pilibacter termitis]